MKHFRIKNIRNYNMDLKRFLIIVSASIVFILFFCNDTIEGQTDGDGNDGSRCGVEDTQSFEVLKGCLDLPDDEAVTCGGNAPPSDSCIDRCITPIVSNSGLTAAQVVDPDRFNEVRPTMEEILSSCAPEEDELTEMGNSDEEPEKIFGVECLNNCEVYFHDCEVKQETTNVNGKRRIVKSYGNIEECPNGFRPDKKCDDVDWGCRQCESGFYVGLDNLCKPNPSVLTIILYSVLFLVIGGILLFGGLKVKEWILKREAKAMASGVKSAGLFPIIPPPVKI